MGQTEDYSIIIIIINKPCHTHRCAKSQHRSIYIGMDFNMRMVLVSSELCHAITKIFILPSSVVRNEELRWKKDKFSFSNEAKALNSHLLFSFAKKKNWKSWSDNKECFPMEIQRQSFDFAEFSVHFNK